MDSRDFITLNEKLGHKIIHTKNYSWMIREDKSALALPTLEDVYPTQEEINYLYNCGMRCVVFKTNISDKNTYEYIFKGTDYGIEKFDSKIRNQIRKGLKSCEILDIKLSDLVEQGFYINTETLQKHERHVKYLETKENWQDYSTVLFNYPDVYIKGAYIENKLIAYVVFIKVEDKYYIYHPFMNFEYSSSNPMNAILFTFINDILQKEKYINISYGLASYGEKPGLDRFKKGMLFVSEEGTRVMAVKPIIRMFINSKVGILFNFVAQFIPNSNSIKNKYEYLLKNKGLYQSYLEFMKEN